MGCIAVGSSDADSSLTTSTRCCRSVGTRLWLSWPPLHRNLWHEQQNDSAGLAHPFAQKLQGTTELLINLDTQSATSTSNSRWWFWGKALAPATGLGTVLKQVGHWMLCFGTAFSISWFKHWQQKECRHGRILGSLKGLEHKWHVRWPTEDILKKTMETSI